MSHGFPVSNKIVRLLGFKNASQMLLGVFCFEATLILGLTNLRQAKEQAIGKTLIAEEVFRRRLLQA